MPRAQTNKLYRTFVKGLITEASPLTFPENASIAEDNCVIFKKGNRTRRFGLDLEAGQPQASFTISDDPRVAVVEYRWQAPGQRQDLNFACIQVETVLHFFDMGTNPWTELPFSVNLTQFASPTQTGFGLTEIKMSSGRGYLFVVGADIEPFLCSYNPDTASLNTQRIYIQIRDFLGVEDGLAVDEESEFFTNEHRYNLRNQGWSNPDNNGAGDTAFYYTQDGVPTYYATADDGPINQYFASTGRYPGNNKQWWIAKATSDRDATTDPPAPAVKAGDFDPALLQKFYFGNNHAPRGHYVVNAFDIDRTTVSGVYGLPRVILNERPVDVAFFAGRAWYVCNSTLYYSQVLDTKNKAGFCYQEADPTAESISDLIASDGGVIPIPEMSRGVRIYPLGGGLIVLGENGVWYVSGGNGGFSALDFSVAKINNIGISGPNSLVEVGTGKQTQIFYWTNVGIQTISLATTAYKQFDQQNITQPSIQGFYNAIDPQTHRYVKGTYDAATDSLQWFYGDNYYRYTRVLNLDMTLGSFYPWSLPSGPGVIIGALQNPTLNPLPFVGDRSPTFTKYLIAYNGDFKNAWFKNADFLDWGTQTFNSYVETGYELLEDAMRVKEANYVFCYFAQTEDSWNAANPDDPMLNRQSSCYFQTKWDWSKSSVSNKWSPKFQAYRLSRVPLFNGDTVFDSGESVVVTKNKVRGSGKALQFRFECNEPRRDFNLLGWAVNYSGNTKP